MTPSPDNGVPGSRGAADLSLRPVPDAEYDAALAQALRHAVEAAPQEVPPPALLADILRGVSAPSRPSASAGTETADATVGDSQPPPPASLALHRTDGPPHGSASGADDRSRRRPTWVRWMPAAAAATFLAAIGLEWRAPGALRSAFAPEPVALGVESSATVRARPGLHPPPDLGSPVSPSPKPASGGGGLPGTPALIDVFVYSPPVAAASPGGGDGGLRFAHLGALPPDSITVLLREPRGTVRHPVAPGIEVAVQASERAEAEGLVRTLAAAAADIPAQCPRKQTREGNERDARPEMVRIEFNTLVTAIWLRPIPAAAGKGPPRRTVQIGMRTVGILLVLMRESRVQLARMGAEAGALYDSRAIVTVRYPEVCGP